MSCKYSFIVVLCCAPPTRDNVTLTTRHRTARHHHLCRISLLQISSLNALSSLCQDVSGSHGDWKVAPYRSYRRRLCGTQLLTPMFHQAWLLMISVLSSITKCRHVYHCRRNLNKFQQNAIYVNELCRRHRIFFRQ